MGYPTRFWFAYPVAGALGLWMILGLNDEVELADARWWIALVVVAFVGLGVGAQVALTAAGHPAIRARAALAASMVVLPLTLWINRQVSPDTVLWYGGWALLGLSVGFFFTVIYRLLQARAPAT